MRAEIAYRAAAGAAALGLLMVATSCAGGRGEELPPVAAGPQPVVPVRVGLERLAAGEAGPDLSGRKLGLVMHAASIDREGRRAAEVLEEAGLDVVRLFAPEHGLNSKAAAGQKIQDGEDPSRGLPVVSLYGGRYKPTAEDLAGLDALLFDLQGAGVRFYTYVSSLILCLEAAAEAGIDFVVLDRPNPLGGERVEGPVSAPRDEVPESFVNLAPGPLIHGLTMGEMARYVNATLDPPARLTVVPMEGWRRDMTWSDTSRPWMRPSANLLFADAALAYPGVALLEATNVSEGRGTVAPFLLLGAPWLNEEVAVPEVAGFALEPTRFTPVAMRSAPKPKHQDRECTGFEVRVADRAVASPYRLGVSLLVALSRQEDFRWRREGDALTWLLGTPRVGRQIRDGATVEEILAADAEDHAAWRRAREPALLYPPEG